MNESLLIYIFDADGFYMAPIQCNGLDSAIKMLLEFMRACKNIRMTDMNDYLVFEWKDGRVIFPGGMMWLEESAQPYEALSQKDLKPQMNEALELFNRAVQKYKNGMLEWESVAVAEMRMMTLASLYSFRETRDSGLAFLPSWHDDDIVIERVSA